MKKSPKKPQLRTKVIGMIKSSPQLKGELISENNIHEQTLSRWIRSNSPKLIMLNNLQLISKHTETPIEQLTD